MIYRFVSKPDLMESNIHLYEYCKEVIGNAWEDTSIYDINRFLTEMSEFFEENR